MIVLNPFLDSLGHSGLKNIGLPPGTGSGCFQSSQDIVGYNGAYTSYPDKNKEHPFEINSNFSFENSKNEVSQNLETTGFPADYIQPNKLEITLKFT